jgi:hypothetical protein
MREVRAMLREGKPLVVVYEPEETGGGGPLEQLQAECPIEL